MNEGFRQFLVMSRGSITGSKYLSHLALGTGGTFLLLDWMDKDESARASLRVSPTGATVRLDW
jgi:hypothetical protein